HSQVGAEHGLRVREGHGEREVVAVAPEDLVGAHLDEQVQVTSGAPALARLAPPGQPDALAVRDAGGDPDVERAGLGDASGATALGALLVDDRADALTLAARLGEA